MSNGETAPGDMAAGVLICDDNASMRTLLRVVVDLSPKLRTVGEAADGNEAIAAAELLQPQVILLDLAMPNRSGLDALPELRRVAPAAEVVVLSGFDSNLVSEQVLALGAASYLEKGASPDEIVATVEQALENAARTPKTSVAFA